MFTVHLHKNVNNNLQQMHLDSRWIDTEQAGNSYNNQQGQSVSPMTVFYDF
jgi:hypothetical protein